jgi:hypothetical protein
MKRRLNSTKFASTSNFIVVVAVVRVSSKNSELY